LTESQLQRSKFRRLNTLVIKDQEEIRRIAEVLSSPIRLQILKYLSEYESISLKTISELTGTPLPIISKHVAKLEKAGLIISGIRNGKRGLTKVVKKRFDRIIVRI